MDGTNEVQTASRLCRNVPRLERRRLACSLGTARGGPPVTRGSRYDDDGKTEENCWLAWQTLHGQDHHTPYACRYGIEHGTRADRLPVIRECRIPRGASSPNVPPRRIRMALAARELTEHKALAHASVQRYAHPAQRSFGPDVLQPGGRRDSGPFSISVMGSRERWRKEP